MKDHTSDNQIPGSFKPRIPAVLIFMLCSVLGSLSLAFYEVPVFCTVALLATATVVFLTARDILPVCGIIVPCILVLTSTNSVGLPAVYIGFIFCFGAGLYLSLGRRWWAPLCAGAAAFGVAMWLVGPARAAIVIVPIVLGPVASLMLRHFSLSETVGILTALGLAVGVSVFLILGGDIGAAADSARTYIETTLSALDSKIIIIEDGMAGLLAAYIVNIAPGAAFAVVSAVIYISCSLALALLRSSGVWDDVPESMKTFTLSPISGFIFICCFFLSTAFAAEGGGIYEKAGAVVDNMITALTLPFIVYGCRGAYNYLMNRTFRSLIIRRKVSGAAVALVFVLVPGASFAIFMCIGVLYSLLPAFTYLKSKLRSLNKIN